MKRVLAATGNPPVVRMVNMLPRRGRGLRNGDAWVTPPAAEALTEGRQAAVGARYLSCAREWSGARSRPDQIGRPAAFPTSIRSENLPRPEALSARCANRQSA